MKVIYPDDYISQINATEEDASYPVNYLVDNDYIKKRWKATSKDAKLTLTVEGEANVVAILGTNATSIDSINIGGLEAQWGLSATWALSASWTSLMASYEEPVDRLDLGGEGVIWIEYDAPEFLHDVEITLSTDDGYVLEAGVAKAGKIKAFNNPEYGFQEGLKDYSIKSELRNGAFYIRKRDVVRTFSGTFRADMTAEFRTFMLDIIRNKGPKPLVWYFVDNESNYWVVYARKEESPPSATHDNPDSSQIDFQLTEVV